MQIFFDGSLNKFGTKWVKIETGSSLEITPDGSFLRVNCILIDGYLENTQEATI